MFCEQCGKQLQEGSAYCAYCGAKVRQEPPRPAAAEVNGPGKPVTAPKGASVQSVPGKKERASGNTKEPGKSGKRKGGVLAVIAAAVVVAAAGVGGYLFLNSDAYRSRQNMKQAQEYFEAREYEKAASCYEEALKLNAGLVEAYLGLADIYLEEGLYEDASALLQRGLRRIREQQEAQELLTEKLEEVNLRAEKDLQDTPDNQQASDSQQADMPSAQEPATEVPETATSAENGTQESSEQEAEPPVEETQYILPESASRYLTMEDLEGLTKEECRIARNELFARHDRLFTDQELQAYFNSLDWYQGTIQPEDFDDSVFNEYEVANRDLITQYEEQQGYR